MIQILDKADKMLDDANKIFDIVSSQSGINRENIRLTNNR